MKGRSERSGNPSNLLWVLEAGDLSPCTCEPLGHNLHHHIPLNNEMSPSHTGIQRFFQVAFAGESLR